jgi:ubiquinone/menaquinone biosynthesis C-methylase UbiE
MNLMLLTVALARLAGVWVRESGFKRGAVLLDLGTLNPTTPIEWIILISVGVLVVALLLGLVVFAGIRLGKWFMRRKPKPTGTPPPLDEPELYDLRTADMKEDLDFWKQMAREIGGPVLELGTRTGRVAIELAKTGLLVTGLEPSRAMLQRARVKSEELSPKTRLEWVEGELYNFSLGARKFRLIIIPMATLQELSDLQQIEQCLRCAAAHLELGGRVVVDVQAPRLEALKVERLQVKPLPSTRTNQVVNYYHSQEAEPYWHKLKSTHEYEIWEGSKSRKVTIQTQGYYFDCPEMLLLLRAAALEVETIYGSYTPEPLGPKSQHLIFLARALRVAPPALAATPALAARPSGKQAALPAPNTPAASDETSPTWPAIPVAVSASSSASSGGVKADAAAPAALPPPSPSSSFGGKAPQPAPAQGLQPPNMPPPGGRPSTGQRRKTNSNR